MVWRLAWIRNRRNRQIRRARAVRYHFTMSFFSTRTSTPLAQQYGRKKLLAETLNNVTPHKESVTSQIGTRNNGMLHTLFNVSTRFFSQPPRAGVGRTQLDRWGVYETRFDWNSASRLIMLARGGLSPALLWYSTNGPPRHNLSVRMGQYYTIVAKSDGRLQNTDCSSNSCS